MSSPAEDTEPGVKGCVLVLIALCWLPGVRPARPQCPLKMAVDWLPGMVAQTTSSHRSRQEGKEKEPQVLHTYYVLCPGCLPNPWEEPEKWESFTYKEMHWAGDLTAEATQPVYDRYGSQDTPRGSIHLFPLLQLYRCEHPTSDGHEFEQGPGVCDRQRSLACCGPWGHKESDTTEQLNWTDLRRLSINTSWFVWTWLGFIQIVNAEILQLHETFERPVNSLVIT